jgi:hypothetical protein
MVGLAFRDNVIRVTRRSALGGSAIDAEAE